MDTLILPILTLGPVSDKMLNQMMTLYISQYRNLPGVAGMAYCTGVHPRRLAARLITIMWDARKSDPPI
jgi:hypothetical protein